MTAVLIVLFFLFCSLIFLVFYSYVVFPIILERNARKKKAITQTGDNMEFIAVSIIISVYNEESVIGKKIDSILKSIYPMDKIEILIGSDASNDKTNEIINDLAAKNSCIRFFPFVERRGKPSVVNELVDMAAHPIIVLTDANVLFEENMLSRLVRNFTNEKVGLAGANILNIGLKNEGISFQEKSYIERENKIKYWEGLSGGSMMGPFGGCYALRKKLFSKVPAHFLVDDFYICMKVIEKNYHAINDMEAICYEDVPDDIWQEYRRKARISAGNFQNLKMFRHFLRKAFQPPGLYFLVHKVIRWMTPFIIIYTWIALAIFSFYYPVAFVFLIGETLLLLTPLIDWLARKAGIHSKLLRFVAYFVFMNLALLKGFFRYMRGIDSGIWTPTKRG